MDSGTIIISLVLIVLAILPFALTGKKYRRQKKQLIITLKAQAEQNNVKLSDYEICSNFGIGMDENSRYLFFARAGESGIKVQQAALWEMVRCRMNTTSRITDEGEKVTDCIELALFPVTNSQPTVVMEMYNSVSDSLTLKGELQVAAKWEQIAVNAIKNLRKPVRDVTVSKQASIA